MPNPLLQTKPRWISLLLLLVVISCTAFGRTPQQELEDLPRDTWPKEFEIVNAKVTVYEPQLETFKGNRITSRAALSLMRTGATEPIFGGLWIETDLETDADRRTAKTVSVKVAEIRFPNLDASEAADLRLKISSEFLRLNLRYSIDQLLAELKLVEERKAAAQALKAEVPQILFRTRPAVLLSMEGEPSWRDLPGSPYRRIANSAFFVIQEPDLGFCFLHIPPFWWIARGPMGPWELIETPPVAVAELWKSEPKPQLPPSDPDQDAPTRPEVIPVNQPSELIWTDGAPQYAPISGTDLLYVKNTESDVFLEIQSQYSYVLLSGRWYRTPADKAAWEFVPSDRLPLDFSRIPLSSEKQHVLACVAGTPQAQEALRDAQIPQTVAVKPGPAPDLSVSYDGDPQFSEVSGSPVRYAVNSPYSVFAVDRRYYCCSGGIWYDSEFAVGPWYVCGYVPTSIYLIPPSCPNYYVTYCRLFSVSAGAYYYGYYPGYRGCYAWGPTVVYGTGWSYRSWRGNYCYPRPLTWGVGVRFNALSCSWNFRLGGGSTCAWVGFYRAPVRSVTTLSVGVGGWSGGVAYRPSGIDAHRNVNFVAPRSPYRAPNLYAQQTERVVTPRVERGQPSGRDPGASFVNPRSNRNPETGGDRRRPHEGHEDGAAAPPTVGSRELPRPPGPSAGHEPGAPPVSPRPEGPRTPPTLRENPRNPDPTPPSAPRENPRTPERKPPPPSREDRESPRTPPPPPRENPRTPERKPPPPPREDRESPRTPPPPPREHREAPRNPPPPREHREAPRNPPPPPREHREEPKEPPRSPGRR